MSENTNRMNSHRWTGLSDGFSWCDRCGSLRRDFLGNRAPSFWVVGHGPAGQLLMAGRANDQIAPDCAPSVERVQRAITDALRELNLAKERISRGEIENAALRADLVEARLAAGIAPAYYGGDLTSYADLANEYGGENAAQPDFVRPDEVRFAVAQSGGYEGHVFVLFERGGELHEAESSHCSCNGHEWGFGETTWAAQALRDPSALSVLRDDTKSQIEFAALVQAMTKP